METETKLAPDSHADCAADPRGLVGTRLGGRYDLKRYVGQMNGATLYEAVRADIDQHVAIGVAHEGTSYEAFAAQWRTTGALQHPNVVAVYGVGSRGTQAPPFCVMEMIHGRTLRDLLADAPLDPARVFALIRQLCSALGAAHAVGTCHLNLTLDSAFASPTAHGYDHVVLTGFLGLSNQTGLTTPADGAAADVESLGRLAFELLSGTASATAAAADASLGETLQLDWPAYCVRSIPAALREVIEAYLAPLGERPASALEALRLLDTINPRSLALADPRVGRPTRKTQRQAAGGDRRKLHPTAKRPPVAPVRLGTPPPQPSESPQPTIARAMLSVGQDFQAVAQITAANIRVIALRVFGADLDLAPGSQVRLTVADPAATNGRTFCTGVVQETHVGRRGRAITVVVALDRRSRGGRYQALLSLWYGR